MADVHVTSDVWGEPTRTSLILRAAGRVPDPDSERAWKDLIERYRAPVERCLRRHLRNHPHAGEAAADFFAYIYEQRVMPKYDRGQARFRCYIQQVVRLYAKHWQRTAGRRDGDELEGLDVGSETPAEFEVEEEVAWAEAILGEAVEKLRQARPRDAELMLRAYGIPPHAEASREDLCRETGMTANALNVAIHRARGALREAILDQVRDLVSEESEFDEEKRCILQRLLESHPGMLGAGA